MLKNINSKLQYFSLFMFIMLQLSLNTRTMDSFSGWAVTRNQAENLNTLSQYVNAFGLGILVWIFLVPKIMSRLDKKMKNYIKEWWLIPASFLVVFYVYAFIHGAILNALVSTSNAEMRKVSVFSQAQVRVDPDKTGFDRSWMKNASHKAAMTLTPFIYTSGLSIKDINDGALTADTAAYQLMPNVKETCEKVVPMINAFSKFYTDNYFPYSANILGDIALTPAAQRHAVYREMMIKYTDDFKRITKMEHAVPPGLTWNQFIHHRHIVDHFRKRLEEKNAPAYIAEGFKPYMSCLEFQSEVFVPEHSKVAREIAATMYTSAAEFEKGEKYYDYGMRAIRNTYIPVVILATTSIITLPIFIFLIAIPLSLLAASKINYPFFVSSKDLIARGLLAFFVTLMLVMPVIAGIGKADDKVGSASGIFTKWQVGVEPLFYQGFGLFGQQGRFSCMADHVFDYNREVELRASQKQTGHIKPVTERWSNCWH